MSVIADERVFTSITKEVADDFATNPFHYGNEDLLIPEFAHRLRTKLSTPQLPVEYRDDYGDPDEWRVRSVGERVPDPGSVCRVRPEVSFVHEGQRWSFKRSIDETERSTHARFDLAVFAPEAPLIMQSKREGPGNYCDTTSELSVLCEFKHSKNESSNFYAPKKGADDIRALATYPGRVGTRAFVFLDWWPRDGNGNYRYDRHEQRLRENIGNLPNEVKVQYIDRAGRIETTEYGGLESHE